MFQVFINVTYHHRTPQKKVKVRYVVGCAYLPFTFCVRNIKLEVMCAAFVEDSFVFLDTNI